MQTNFEDPLKGSEITAFICDKMEKRFYLGDNGGHVKGFNMSTGDSLKDFIPKSQNYVASIGGWMRYHGTRLNIANKRNDELEKMKDVDGNISLKVFQKEGPWIGLRDTSTVKGLKQYLENGLAKVNNGLGLVLRTVESNPDAFAQGVVPNDLLPTVQEQNDIVSNSFKNLKTNLTAVVLRIDAAIKAAAAEAKAGAKGTKS